MKDYKPEELKTLAESFKKSWDEVKEKLDSQRDEVRAVTEVVADLVQAQKEYDEVLRKLIDNGI